MKRLRKEAGTAILSSVARNSLKGCGNFMLSNNYNFLQRELYLGIAYQNLISDAL